MNKSCPSEVNQCLPCNDAPLENLSAELPDLPTYLGLVTIPNDPVLGDKWSSLGCKGWVFSTISIEDAKARAALQDCGVAPPEEPPSPPPPDTPPTLDIDMPWDPAIVADCLGFDCCDEGTPFAPNFSTRPRAQIGASVYWFTDPGPQPAHPYEWVQTETVDRWNAYFNEIFTQGRYYCNWETHDDYPHTSVLVRIGSRWEIYIFAGSYVYDVANNPVCSADTGPPSFDCTAIGCAEITALLTTDIITLYYPNFHIAVGLPDGSYTEFGPPGCPGLELRCTTADDCSPPPAYCWSDTGGGFTFRTCYGATTSPVNPWTLPCSFTVKHYDVGGLLAKTVRQYYKGVRNSSANSGSPRGTYIPDSGNVYDNCGQLKAETTELPVEAVVTLEVPPP